MKYTIESSLNSSALSNTWLKLWAPLPNEVLSKFKSSTNRAPRKFTKGEKGEEKWLYLKLKLIADIGNYPVNGNWPPHLHFQISIDMMGERENFPGVSEDILLSVWSKISPDPNLILGIPNSFFIKKNNITNAKSKINKDWKLK